jgi:hypothetical protein
VQVRGATSLTNFAAYLHILMQDALLERVRNA